MGLTGFLKSAERVVAAARSLIGLASYARLAQLDQAPATVNCLTLVTWSFREAGLSLPPTLDQVELGMTVDIDELAVGDLIFTAGFQVYLDAYGGIGHVGIMSGDGTVIHATRRIRLGRNGVHEETLANFLAQGEFRIARRLIGLDLGFPAHGLSANPPLPV